MSGEAPTVVVAPVPDLSGWLGQQAQAAIQQKLAEGTAQIVAQATAGASDVATNLHSKSIEAIAQVTGRVEEVAASVAHVAAKAVSDAIPQIKDEVLASIHAVSDNVQHDKITQRHLAIEAVGFFGVAALSLLIAYLAGSPQAKGIVAWALLPGGIASLIVARLTGLLNLPGSAH